MNLAIGNHYDRETEIMYIPYEIQLDGEKVSDFSPTPFESYYSYWTLKDVSEAHTVSIKYKDCLLYTSICGKPPGYCGP